MSRVFSGFFNTVSMEFQASFKGGLEGLNELSGVFHGNLKGVQRKVHAFLRMLQGYSLFYSLLQKSYKVL